jgi:hypothetical protein
MEMAICKLYQQSTSESKAIPKILYIAPIKQLVTEKRMEWERYCASENKFAQTSLRLQLFRVSWIESHGTDGRYIK